MRGSVVRRGSRFYVAIYLGADPATRRRRYKWISGFESEKHARAFCVKVAQSPAFGSGVGPRGSTRLRVGDYLDQWLRTEVPLRCRPSGVRRRESIIRVHLKPALAHVPLAKLAPVTIQEFVSSLKGRSARYIFVILRAALRHAVQMELILSDPTERVTPPRSATYEPIPWTADETVRFLAACRQFAPNYWPLFLTASTTGLRQSELLGAPWRALDGDTLRVSRTLDRDGRAFSEPKSRRSQRVVRLQPEVVEELRLLRRHQLEERMRRGLCSKNGTCRDRRCRQWHDHDLIFCQPNGKPLHGHNLSSRVMPWIIARAGVPKARFHDLRHAHGTLLDAAGVSLKVISERLGHSSEAFTLARYVHSGERQRDAVEAVSRRLLSNRNLINLAGLRSTPR